jgi:hypothetical protein
VARNLDSIIAQIQEKLRKLPENNKIPPVLTLEQIKAAEQLLGFPLPELLRQLYLYIGNGWFGPGFGIYPLVSNRNYYGVNEEEWEENSDWLYDSIVSSYLAYKRTTSDEHGEWREGMIPLCYYGCCVDSVMDCFTEEGTIWGMDANKLYPQPEAKSLREWLETNLEDFQVSDFTSYFER